MSAGNTFQFTPLREGRRSARIRSDWLILFQFTPLREGRRHHSRGKQSPSYFNSRPSARGDGIPHYVGRAGYISIHAPPRGATHHQRISSHQRQFQFTPLREGRPARLDKTISMYNISIHAPPRGATKPTSSHSSLGINFNSRPSARGDGKRYAISANLLFNPYKSAWLNNSATQFVEIILVIFHRIIA